MGVLFVSAAIVVLDQLTKLAIKGINIPWLGIHFTGVPLGSSKQVWGDYLRITYIENPGMAFGIDIGYKLFLSLVSIAASVGIIAYLWRMRTSPWLYRLSLSMILGGAIGNLIDRVFYGVIFDDGGLFHGKVVDFIDADFININLLGLHLNRFPVFNVADASVTCGVILLLLVHHRATQETETLTPALAGEPGAHVNPEPDGDLGGHINSDTTQPEG